MADKKQIHTFGTNYDNVQSDKLNHLTDKLYRLC